MKKESFTRNRSGGWLSNLGKSVLLMLFACCFMGVQQGHGQNITINFNGPIVVGGPQTGSGATVSIDFNFFINNFFFTGEGPNIFDPSPLAKFSVPSAEKKFWKKKLKLIEAVEPLPVCGPPITTGPLKLMVT